MEERRSAEAAEAKGAPELKEERCPAEEAAEPREERRLLESRAPAPAVAPPTVALLVLQFPARCQLGEMRTQGGALYERQLCRDSFSHSGVEAPPSQ